MGSQARAEHLGYAYADGRVVFSGVDLVVHRQRYGLVGRNGCGKSTLIKLLAGALAPTHGSIQHAGPVGWLPQDAADRLGASGDATVATLLGIEARLAALRRLEQGDTSPAVYDAIGDDWDVEARAAAWLAQVGLAPSTLRRTAASLSGGERTRVQLARLLRDGPGLLLLDEPTNHLDRDGREALLAFIATWSGALIVASHDRELLDAMDTIWELGERGLAVYGGNYSTYEELRAVERDAADARVASASQALERANDQAATALERQARRQAQGARSAPKAGLPKILLGARKRQGQTTMARLNDVHAERRAQAEQRLADAKSRVDRERLLTIDMPDTALGRTKQVLELTAVNARFDGPGAPPLWSEPLTAALAGPRRIALTGPNGAGKSTLLGLILGRTPPGAVVSGDVRLHLARVAYLDQALADRDPRLSVLEHLRQVAPDQDETTRRIRLGRFLFDAALAQRPLAELSGGERLRASLALTLLAATPPQLLLLDEPSNHLDLASIHHLEQALAGYGGALIVTSHDTRFLDALALDGEWRLERSGLLFN